MELYDFISFGVILGGSGNRSFAIENFVFLLILRILLYGAGIPPQHQGFLKGKSTNASVFDFIQSLQCLLDKKKTGSTWNISESLDFVDTQTFVT